MSYNKIMDKPNYEQVMSENGLGISLKDIQSGKVIWQFRLGQDFNEWAKMNGLKIKTMRDGQIYTQVYRELRRRVMKHYLKVTKKTRRTK